MILKQHFGKCLKTIGDLIFERHFPVPDPEADQAPARRPL